MKKEVFVDISARHVHLCQEDQDKLFGEGYELHVHKPIGDGFASVEQIEVVGPRNSFKKVRILGPCRKATQIELSKTDARTLGVDAPIRLSGDVAGSPGLTLIGPNGAVEVAEGAIVAKRHIHVGTKTMEDWGLKQGDIVAVRIDTEQRTTIYADTEIRLVPTETEYATMHIDTDEANAAGMPGPMNGYIVEL